MFCKVGSQSVAIMERNFLLLSPNFGVLRGALIIFLVLIRGQLSVYVRPATFAEDFHITWGGDHIKQMTTNSGNAIQVILDRSSGSGFASKKQYLFGRDSVRIKLIPGDSAGTVTAFYMNSDTGTVRDELDFEFLGNRSGEPYTIQTNVYAHGKGDREQRVNLWFDPSADFHAYSLLWNHYHVVFFVDEVPIRVYKNNQARGIPYPKSQPMRIYSTLWEADNWATRGGLDKIDWSKAPFYAYYKDFDIEACSIPGSGARCASDINNSWEAERYRGLTPLQAKLYRWVRMNHMIYDYCTDKSRYSVPPPSVWRASELSNLLSLSFSDMSKATQ